jgi:hypothetical protein
MLPHRIRTDGFVTPCNPTRATKPPSGPDWVHEIKHDGYRLIVRREGTAVQLFTRRGHDWTDRYPAIAAAAGKLRVKSFTLDGEAVVSGVDGVAVFDALHRRRRATDAMLYAFDLLELNGKDLRPLPLVERKVTGAVAGKGAPRHHVQRAHRPLADVPYRLARPLHPSRRTIGASRSHSRTARVEPTISWWR